MTEHELGHVESVPVGSLFHNRTDVKAAGLHRHLVNGIDGDERVTRSLVAAGVYSGDKDHGVTLWYAGQGGLDRDTGRQIEHQRFEGPNAGLAASSASGMVIRLIRGWGPKKGAKVYRYDGLYRVSRYWLDQTGHYDVCMYQLEAVESDVGYAFEPDLDEDGHPSPANPEKLNELTRLTYSHASQTTRQRFAVLEKAAWRCEACSALQNISAGKLLRAVMLGTGGAPSVLCTTCYNDRLRSRLL
ncbi:YDG/SRA domain-containing protein [Arthrobacter sp. ok909]|uniref:YDG/SRA domain-containing protein n=1 Tax=Arthrobacter sp. ok909 TaxID=1761746 RepID=UPI0015876CB1|nr:YDG/SRA domain-containing protein [Arthrobacter sp. ok909]